LSYRRFFGNTTGSSRVTVYDIQEVPGSASHITPGMYVLLSFSRSSSLGDDARLFLTRLVERNESGPGFITGFFDVAAIYDLGPVDETFATLLSTNGVFNMIYKDID